MAKQNRQSKTKQRVSAAPGRREVTPYWASEDPPQFVEPGWLLKAGGAVLALALVCAYALICLVFVKTQWQMVLHPARAERQQPADLGLDAQQVQFVADGSAQPQLRGWWIPAPSPNSAAVLMLHGANGSAADLLPRAKTFHEAGLNVLLFDDRGFGRSPGAHPTEHSMTQDSETALAFLNKQKALATDKIVVYGFGVGASLAVRLCAEHQTLPALVVEAPEGDFAERLRTDKRASLVPFRLLFTQDFPLAGPLHELTTPKLLVTYGARPPEIITRAAQPKMSVELPGAADSTDWVAAVRRFLDSYGPKP